MSAPFQAPAPPDRTPRSIPRTPFIAAGLVTFVVLVIGGYVFDWAWTGFGDNDTLWDWLNLLLLPFIIATVPIWLEHGEYLDARVRRIIIGVVAGFAALVVAGYAVPLAWTGFTGNTLWDWLGLIMLPFVIATIRLWSELRPRLSQRHFVIAAMEISVLVAVVLAGYLVPWEWTGFTGNTLWDWIQLLLVPILLPTVLMPAARDFIKTGVDERRELVEGPSTEHEEESDDLGYAAPDADPDPEPSSPEARRARGNRTALAAAAIAAVLIGGVAAAAAFRDGTTAPDTTTAAPAAAAATPSTPCSGTGAKTLAANEDGRVVRVGQSFYACLGDARPIKLATGKPGTSTANFAVTPERVAFTVESCNAAKTACSAQLMVARARDGRVFNPQRFENERVAGLALTPKGGIAVMLREPSKLVLIDRGQTRDAAEGPGLDPDSLASVGSTVYWRMNGRPASAQLSA
jgi:hypothetical protein